MNEMEHPLNPLCTQWLAQIDDAIKDREEKFGKYAREAEKFFDSEHNFMWDEEYAAQQQGGFLDKGQSNNLPMFRMSVNKPFEAVALFVPAMYHQNPQISVTPTKTPEIPPEIFGFDMTDPQQVQQYQLLSMRHEFQKVAKATHGELKQHYLNWLQVEADKKTHSRRAIQETVITGLSYLETRMHTPPGSRVKYPKSRYLSWRDVVVDPDARYWEDVQWVGIRGVAAVNRVEREYGFDPGTLRGQMESRESQGRNYSLRRERNHRKQMGQSHDLLDYWRVFSKNGFGDKLKTKSTTSYKSKFDFSMFGDYCNIVVSRDIPYPLNMPSWSLAEDPDSLFMRAQWPIPFWTDGGWPFTRMFFWDKPNCIWPVGLFKPVIGELRFVNWCMSFLADKVAAASTTYVGVFEAAGMKIQDQLQSGLAPFTVIELSEITGKRVEDVISFLDAPAFSLDVWRMVAEVLEMIDKRTGLTELVYGMSSKQVRSAREAEVKDANTSIRPDDMANRVEECLSEVAMKECEAITWMGEYPDLVGPLGEDGARIFMEQIKTADFDLVVRDFSYRIVAGSARKPNKNTRIANLNDFGQIALPTIQQFAAAGQVQPWNAFMLEIGKAMDFDAEPFLLPAPDPEADSGPSKEELQAMLGEMKILLEQRKHEQDMQQDQEQHEQEMEQAREKHAVDIQAARAKATASRSTSNVRAA